MSHVNVNMCHSIASDKLCQMSSVKALGIIFQPSALQVILFVSLFHSHFTIIIWVIKIMLQSFKNKLLIRKWQ